MCIKNSNKRLPTSIITFYADQYRSIENVVKCVTEPLKYEKYSFILEVLEGFKMSGCCGTTAEKSLSGSVVIGLEKKCKSLKIKKKLTCERINSLSLPGLSQPSSETPGPL